MTRTMSPLNHGEGRITTNKTSWKNMAIVLLTMSVFLAACGSDAPDDAVTSAPAAITSSDEPAAEMSTTTPVVDDAAPLTQPDTADDPSNTSPGDTQSDAVAQASNFTIEVWADNWAAVYVNGELIGEDSVPITSERSFNAETFTFEATYPFTIGIEAKDFKETDSGIEYIGLRNQQMGDGGIIAQITDQATGDVIAVTDAQWSALVVHQAPLNTECVKDADPDATCEFLILETPAGWAEPDFDDASWQRATEWTTQAVSPKDGYDAIDWDVSAQLIWGTDLEVDNTVLLRFAVS